VSAERLGDAQPVGEQEPDERPLDRLGTIGDREQPGGVAGREPEPGRLAADVGPVKVERRRELDQALLARARVIKEETTASFRATVAGL
jgi:hypothetical protein